MLDGFTPVKRLQLPKGIFGCRFNKGDISTVILWGLEMHPGEIRSFSCSNRSKLTFRDIFGNQTNRNELGLSPLYITASSAEIDNFLRTLKVKSVRNIAAEATSGSLHTTLDNVPPQISVNNDGDTEVLLKWKNKQQIEWIEVAWKMGKRPEKYHISYLLPDGNWRYVQGTWRGWRKLRIEQENFPILKISTTALRLTWHDPQQQKSELLTFRPYSIKRITPQQTEMQEVYSREFHPDSNGFITDFLICGPFPASGKRLPNQYPTDWKFDFLKDHYHYGRRWTEATLHPKIEQRHIVEFPRTPKTDWKVGKGAVHWIPYHATSPLVDMAKVFEKSALFSKPKLVESCYGYAFSTLVLSKPFKGTVSIGSDDGYRIWLDSKQLCEKVAYRSAVPDSEEYPLSLQPGEHHLMIRLHNDIGGHGFYLRLLDNAKKPFTDYSIKLVEKTWGK